MRAALRAPQEEESMIGVIRLLGVIGTFLLGGLALLWVLGIVPPEALQEWGVKLLLVLGILAAVAVVVSLLMGRGERR